jgi:hypothetical protein
MGSDVSKPDGSVDFSGGVNSIKVTTVQGPRNPNGLSRNELAWLNNATVRDGGITQRAAYKLKGRMFAGDGIFQGAFMYDAPDGTTYPIVAKGGKIYKIDPETGVAINLSDTAFNLTPFPVGVYLKNLNAPPGSIITVEAGTQANTSIGLLGNYTAPAVNGTVFAALATAYRGAVNITVPITNRFTLISAANTTLHITNPPANSLGYWTADLTIRNENMPPGVIVGVQPNGGLNVQPLAPYVGPPVLFTVPSFVTPALGGTVTVSVSCAVRSTAGAFSNTAFTSQITSILFDQINLLLVNSSFPPDETNVGGMPAFLDYFYFCQAEEFLIIQAGDYKTLPLFWDGTTLRRSRGITNTALASQINGQNEIPAAGPMDYYMGRVWYAQGRSYSAGDIVGGPSGTGTYNFRDSVLNVTENPLAIGGDGFRVPDSSGNITALSHNANLDAALGQGRLFIFTLKTVYNLVVPVTRTDWIASTSANQPLQSVVQIANGSVNDRSVVPVNGDLFFQSLEPAIRSAMTSIRYFGQWGNIQFSANENRVLALAQTDLLRFATGINFNNRMLQSTLPRQVAQGVIHSAVIPLDFMPISTFGETHPPTWEGIQQGLSVLQLLVGTINNVERAFAIALSDTDSSFMLWELTKSERFEADDTRVKWSMEFPALNWGEEFELKELIAFELWVDRMAGEVAFYLDYRPDSDPCWYPWHKWKQCSARNTCEDVFNPICYPIQPFQETFRATMITPKPPVAGCEALTGRPAYVGYQFQVRLTIVGFCRVRGFLLHANPVEKTDFPVMTCNTQNPP